jgi:chemotaxis protein methyltransferase CheR
MTGCISERLLEKMSEFVASRMGLYFPRERWRNLERGMLSAAKEFGFKDAESCAEHLLSSPPGKNAIEVLAGCLTVGETYFFREKASFRAVEEQILPELIRSRREEEKRLRIWSAGCATGEEPYSVAVLLSKMLPDLKSWNVTILATDINPLFLARAAKGVYGEWSFRDTPEWVRHGYFRKTAEGRFEILPRIREMVTFSYHNLAEDAYPSLLNNTNAMDIIFCRNVLMYFAPSTQRKAILNLYRSLVDRGWLIVSPSEISNVLFPEFEAINVPGATFYRKQGSGIGGIIAGDATQSGILVCQVIPGDALRGEFFPINGKDAGQADIEDSIEGGISDDMPPDEQDPGSEGQGREAASRPPVVRPLPPEPYDESLFLYEQGRYDEAAETIIARLSVNKYDSKALALLARVYANQGRLSDALEWSEKAVASDKLAPDLYYLLATILQEQGKTGEAVEALRRALYLDPDFALAHFALGNLMRRQGRQAESEKYFINALSLLRMRGKDEILEASEGLTAGRLVEIINSTLPQFSSPPDGEGG